MTLAAVSLDDKYELEKGRVFLTGVQALVRLPMLQRQRDVANGLNTGSFISGYRGSPLAVYDQQLHAAQRFLEKNHIRFVPGVNEDLAATAVWGSQQLHLSPGARYDGVFSIWYGKGPGVDRCGDVFKHLNMAGTAQHGGVLLLCGDDHYGVSSTALHQSEHNMMAALAPVLYPAGVQEYLDYGLLGWAMSRYAGVAVAFKCVTEVVESAASVSVDPERLQIALPEDFTLPEGGLNIRWPDDRWQQEERLHKDKMYAALAFARANKIDRVVLDSPKPRFGIVTTGKSYLDVRQALDDLGIDEAMAAEIGIRLYKVGMPWPLEREGARRFAEGLSEVLVIEEKRAVIENQLREQLYNWRADVRPRVVGKFDENGEWLVPSVGELSPSQIARIIVDRLKDFVSTPQISARMDAIERAEANRQNSTGEAPAERLPYFCSGCPHNTSTRVPEGSRALAGIGCHFMALWMDRSTETFTQMGGEGVPWIGIEPFTDEKHIFANLGDGTYYHSGLLAIRAAVAAKASMTYKILYNDAVAMTGGQSHDGPLTPPQISQQVHAEGVARIIVVTDEPDKYPLNTAWAPGVRVEHRDGLDRIQKELRDTEGVSVLIYDQTCAAEKRRRRKRGTFPDPDERIFINDLVCEGCGDCSAKSNCVSVEPLDTPFGRKRQINQSACNKDFSCIKGFCPSFVSVKGGTPRKTRPRTEAGDPLADKIAQLPMPELPVIDKVHDILITGIGGTGVITVGQLLGMAAHLEGKGTTVLDFTGIAQKNGAVMSHVRIAESPEDIHAVRVAAGGCDTLLACDMVVAASDQALRKFDPGRTRAVVNSHLAPTAAFTLDPDSKLQADELRRAITRACGDNLTEFVDATRLATTLMGDAIATNLFVMGTAWQRGLLPVSLDAIQRAIELNGVAVEMNRRTFALGRLAAVDPLALERAARPPAAEGEAAEDEDRDLEAVIARRRAFLVDYQDEAYAERYERQVRRIAEAEEARAPGRQGLADAAARNLFKLMAYKDEYEVARLYADPRFREKLAEQFEGRLSLEFHLAPPLFSRRDPETGELEKRRYGGWMLNAFRLLARLKGLRGGPFDLFGRTEERRTERRLVADYAAVLEEIAGGLGHDNHALAIEFARLPERIRGFGHVKERNLKLVEGDWQRLLELWRKPQSRESAAE